MAPAISTLVPHLAHFSSYLDTTNGLDKTLMLFQYLPMMLPASNAGRPVLAMKKLGAEIGEFRIGMRLFGLIPIITSFLKITTTPSLLQKTSTTQLLQLISILCYYPLEHVYWLSIKKVLVLPPKTIAKVARWSCRFWMFYVLLSLRPLILRHLALKSQSASLLALQKQLNTSPKTEHNVQTLEAMEKELKEKWGSWTLDAVEAGGYLPLTLHWSLANGLFSTPFPTGFFGTIACVAQIVRGWRATTPASVAVTAVKMGADGSKEAKMETVAVEGMPGDGKEKTE